MKKDLLITILVLQCFLFASGGQARTQDRAQVDELRNEEAEDYFKKWLTEDVVYIINREERDIFQQLTSLDEKEQFIEQFWFRRDPDPRTAINEFKDEHYRRIAYVNERFGSGEPGWKTDRGRIYIIHGPPDQIEPHPTGGPYDRPLWEGGGTTVTFPFEVWRYRHIEGVGDDIILEFVDPAYSGEYRLALDPDEKDAFAKVPTLGDTWEERDGMMTRRDRGTHLDTRYYLRRDQPFDRYYRYTDVQRTPRIQYKDLQELVNVNVTYDELPVDLRIDQFKLGDDQMIVPVTIEVQNQDLNFVEEDGSFIGEVAVYGLITSLTNQIAAEFEHELVSSFSVEELPIRAYSRSLYQKVLVLERRGRYKADIVVKDLKSGKMSVVRLPIVPKNFGGDALQVSSVVIADQILQLPEIPDQEEMFVLGDVRVRPFLGRRFMPGQPMGIYLQLYNVGLDQSTNKPGLDIAYHLFKGGERFAELKEEAARSIQYFSDARVVIYRSFPTSDLPPGKYKIEIKIHDQIKGESLNLLEGFEIRES